MGGSFHTSALRSTQAPPEGTTSGGAEDLDKLTALSSLVSTLMQKVNTQESELKAHKLLFKEVVGKVVKRVKLGDVDPLIKLAKAAAIAAAASAILMVVLHGDVIPPKAARERMKKREDEWKEREEMQRKRQQDVLNSAKYYTDSDWNDIMGQVHANQGLTADLLGPDVNEDNFAERMVDHEKHVKSFFDDQLQKSLTKSEQLLTELQSQNIRRSLKRPCANLEQASSKKSKPTEAPKSSVPDKSQQPSAEPRTHSYGTRRKSLGTRKKSSTELDLTADDRSFIRVLSDDSDDSNDDDDPPIFWPAFAAWEEIFLFGDRKDLFELYGLVVLVLVFGQINSNGLSRVGDTPYPLSAQLMKKMLKHKLEVEIDGIGNDTVGNELTTAVQLIAFLKKQISDSRCPKVHDCPRLDVDCLVAGSTHMKVAFGVGFKMISVPSSGTFNERSI
ncbi:hypothetical protein Tco_1153759 [Tanacetum coccineum]